jgi:hypothetical protein
MANIRFVRVGTSTEDWQLDCIVLPSDETNGELVHHHPNIVKDFRNKVEPGLYLALKNLIDRLSVGAAIPKTDIRLTLAKFEHEKRTYFSLMAPNYYPPRSPEADVWRLIDVIYEKRKGEVAQSQRIDGETPTS